MIAYGFVRNTLGSYMRLGMGFRVEGAELVPERGPLIVCPNHLKWLDPVVVANGTRRRIYFMAKHELFRTRLLRAVYESVGAFPVRRGEVDRASLRRCINLLKEGEAVGIFPEGTRSTTGLLGPGEPGAAVISLLTGALIAPVGIVGYRPGSKLELRWGKPIDPAAFGGAEARRDKRAVTDLTDAIMAAIAGLTGQKPPSAQALAGEPATPPPGGPC